MSLMGFCSLAELRLCSEHVLTVHVWELVLLQALSVYDPIEPVTTPWGWHCCLPSDLRVLVGRHPVLAHTSKKERVARAQLSVRFRESAVCLESKMP